MKHANRLIFIVFLLAGAFSAPAYRLDPLDDGSSPAAGETVVPFSRASRAAVADPVLPMAKPWTAMWKKDKTEYKDSDVTWWKRTDRIRLWFFNPNGAGTFFAEIAAVFLALAILFARGFWRIHFGFAALTFTVLIFYAGSRGSLLALASAGLILGYSEAYSRFKRKGVLLLTLAFALTALLMYLGIFGDHFGKDFFLVDSSNVQRVRSWLAAPSLIAAAPGGWGEFCGKAYCDWFQPMDDMHPLVYLVNTHLTWMAACGWTFSFLYVAAWCALFGIIMFTPERRARLFALSAWTLFFVANWFSTLGIFKSLWVIPSLALVPAIPPLARRIKAHPLGFAATTAFSAAAGVAVCAVLIAAGASQLKGDAAAVRRTGGIVTIGYGSPEVYLAADYRPLSRFRIGSFGKDVREWMAAHPGEGTLHVVESLDSIPQGADRLVLSGLRSADFLKAMKDESSRTRLNSAGSIAFLSPVTPSTVMKDAFYHRTGAQVFLGEHLAKVNERSAKPWVHVIPGAELYIPGWMNIVMKGALPQ